MRTHFQHIKGTFDILPESSVTEGNEIPGAYAWHYVETVIRQVLTRYGFRELRTPILEPTELIARGIGRLTDIVSKEMFAFERGDTHYVLRPEMTAPVMRAYLEHRLDQAGGIQKLFYIGPCFRAERPQKGRYRQFHQFGCEIIGASDPRADVETIAAMMAVYETFGVEALSLRVNTVGDEQSRPRYKAALQAFLEPHAHRLTETSRKRLESNPLRILDTKVAAERDILRDAPLLTDYIDEASKAHYEEVKRLLAALGIPFVEDPFLVRGLDYYTRTAFEVESPLLGAQSALAGGGRYDLLALEFGNDAGVPAVGFAAGMERLFLAIGSGRLPRAEPPDVFLVALGDEAGRWAFVAAQTLRKNGLQVALDLTGRSRKAQMREANRQGAVFTVIVDDEALAAGQARIRRMDASEETVVGLQDLASYFKSEKISGTAYVSTTE